MGKTLFISSNGNSTLAELNITDRSFVTVAEVTPPPPVTAQPKKVKNSSTKKSGKKTYKKKGGKKQKKQRQSNCSYNNNTLETHKVEHSRKMSLVFEEVETSFKEIRQRLSNLSIKKTPKKSAVPKKTSHDVKLELASVDKGIGGKAGKTIFPLLVGRAENLYLSAKKKNQRCNLRTIPCDLHAFSKEEALEKLSSSLPVWFETAMMGEHPFVIKVDVICGGGNQVLAEVVERWIRQNKQVANRPKSFC